MDRTAGYRRGYVDGPFHIFHLTDIPEREIPLHFHDFRKVVILLQGSLFYDIEGRRYALESGDIVLVDAGELHHPILTPRSALAYDRLIIYLADDYFTAHAGADLDRYFRLLKEGYSHVISGTGLPDVFRDRLYPGLAEDVTRILPDHGEARLLLQTSRLTEFLLYLNHVLPEQAPGFREPITQNPAVRQLMEYLTEHLTEPLDIERAAGSVHLDRSYLMHMFKAETGSTIMSYVTEKRLFLAQSLITRGIPATDACYRSGFTNYTSFYRAYRSRYGCSPRSGGDALSKPYRE